ncbi:MAG: 16S rRNA (guanine(527)-N(7))-methyltransferase RsmG [Candidatus Latescibacterota bacterium]|nr:MAG: 16S rRNA (guanine(527)-N(7))-methyltransferase RsmG [Candidatus Latescibacterota bacterium]
MDFVRSRTQTPQGRRQPQPPGPERLQALFARSGIRLSATQVDLFWRFHQLLRQRNAELDLTRLHSFDNMVLKLYVDSALVATLVDLPSPLLDLGSGAGFPGIPLKIMRPDLQMILAEARAKRVGFLREAVGALALRDVEIVHQRIGRKFEGHVAGVITRAVEAIPDTLRRLSTWIEPGVRILFMKGPGCGGELDAVARDHADSYRVTLDREYVIPQTPHARRLVVVQRRTESRPMSPPPVDRTPGAQLAAAGDASAASGAAAGHTWRAHEIRSAGNARFKRLLALRSGRAIRKTGLALVAGMRPILEIVRDDPERCVAWITAGAPAPPAEAPPALEWDRLSPELFRRVDSFGTGPPLLLIRVPQAREWEDRDWPPGCTLFLPFQDPENVGALLRSAAAFGVTRAVMLEGAANPFHPRSVRAAGGSTLLRLPLLRGPSLQALEVTGAPLIALSPKGQEIEPFQFPPAFGLVAGIEGPGLPPSLHASARLRIPMRPGIESLNASTATAIALYLWQTQQRT